MPPASPRNLGRSPLIETAEGDAVQCVTLDDLRLAPVAVVKIDVEGMELDVLKGASFMLENLRSATSEAITRTCFPTSATPMSLQFPANEELSRNCRTTVTIGRLRTAYSAPAHNWTIIIAYVSRLSWRPSGQIDAGQRAKRGGVGAHLPSTASRCRARPASCARSTPRPP
jgi:methyltransferase FkbM-like protein